MQLARAGVISRTRGALLLSGTQASVAEFSRQTLAPDVPRAPCSTSELTDRR